MCDLVCSPVVQVLKSAQQSDEHARQGPLSAGGGEEGLGVREDAGTLIPVVKTGHWHKTSPLER